MKIEILYVINREKWTKIIKIHFTKLIAFQNTVNSGCLCYSNMAIDWHARVVFLLNTQNWVLGGLCLADLLHILFQICMWEIFLEI